MLNLLKNDTPIEYRNKKTKEVTTTETFINTFITHNDFNQKSEYINSNNFRKNFALLTKVCMRRRYIII